MKLLNFLKTNKLLLLNILFAFFILTNLIGGERGLISYFDKKTVYENLLKKEKSLISELEDLEHKISLVKNNDLDYLDMIYREKLKYGTKDEILIKLK